MGILLYQIGIFISIQLSTFYGGKTARNVAIILISIFTILQVFTSQLMILQFFTIFISYLISRNILGKSNGKLLDNIVEEVDDFVSGTYKTENKPIKTAESKNSYSLNKKEINDEDIELEEDLEIILEELVNSYEKAEYGDQKEEINELEYLKILETDHNDKYKAYAIIEPFIEFQNKNITKLGYHPDRINYSEFTRDFKLFAQTNRNLKKFTNTIISNEYGSLFTFINWSLKVNPIKHEIYLEFLYKFFRKSKL